MNISAGAYGPAISDAFLNFTLVHFNESLCDVGKACMCMHAVCAFVCIQFTMFFILLDVLTTATVMSQEVTAARVNIVMSFELLILLVLTALFVNNAFMH